jgi:HK97 family phage major capsid protein
MDKLKDLRERQAKLVAEARAKYEEIKDDTPEARAVEIEAEYDEIMAAYDALEVEANAIEEREERKRKLEEREAALNRPDPRRPLYEAPPAKANEDKDIEEARAKAFQSYLRYGTSGLSPEQRGLLTRAEERAQGVAVGTQGGYLVPEGFMAELVVALKAWGPMLDPGVTRFLTTATGASIPWPTMDDTSNEGALIAENTQVALAEISFGTKNLEAYKYTSGVVLVASELLQDSAVDVESVVRSAMAERIARVGNKHTTIGDGASKPHGIVSASSAGATAASATAITFDDLIELEHAVDPAYRSDPSCRFMFNDSTLKAIRKLKDGEDRYVWQPADVRTGSPTTILNYPYSVNQALASIGTGNRSVVFGAFNRYVVRMVNEFSVRRLIERYADYDQTGFIGFTRLDGELIDANAIKRLTHP